MKGERPWNGKCRTVLEYEPFDSIRPGDIVLLGDRRTPRKVLDVRRTPDDDAVRVVDLNRLQCGYDRASGNKYCSGPVIVWRTELKAGPYRFRGFAKMSP